MKNLINYIHNEFIIEDLYQIDSEIICESLNCTVLKEVAAQLLKNHNEDQQKIIDYQKQREAEGRSYWGPAKSKVPKFTEIFAKKFYIAWDKITDNDVTVVDASSWDKSTPHNSSEIRKVINTKKNSMLIVQDPESKVYEFFIYKGGKLILLNDRTVSYYNTISTGSEWDGLNQKQKIDLCKGKTLYYIDNIRERQVDRSDITTKRSEQKQGMIYMDPDSLRRIAERNRERYKKIITKMKTMNMNEDPLFDTCSKIIKKITDLSIELAKDPITNADMLSGVSMLMPWICDTERYESTGKYTGHYKGVNGLLPQIIQYAKYVKYASEDGSEYYLNIIKSSKKNIENALKKIEDIAKRYNINLN